jgi:predicted dehydrogenase
MSLGEQPAVALIGVGRWGRHILRDLTALGCEVHVVARSESSIAHAREHGAKSIAASVVELPEVSAGVVASLTSVHAESIDALAAHTAGPIFSEKPLTADVEQARRLVNAYGERLFVMDKWRYHAGILKMAELAKSGELGEIQGVSLRRVTMRNPHPDVSTVWTHIPHDLSIAYEVLGEVPPLRTAVGERVAGQLRGATAILGDSPWVQLETSDCAPDHRREARVVGTDAAVILDGGWADHVTVRNFRGEDVQIATPGELPLMAELRAFVDHVKGGPAPKSSAQVGLTIVERIQEIIDAAEGTA